MNHRGFQELVVRNDRVVFTSDADLKAALRKLSDFRTVSDYALLNLDLGPYQGPYGRVRNLVNDSTKTRITVSYKPRYRRLSLIRVAVVPNDLPGLRRRELAHILQAFAPHQLAIVEMAIDVPRIRNLNAEVVRRHLKFGKARMRRNWRFPKAVWLGAPASAKFLRCYPKPEVRGFRVEAQFNRAFLKKHRIKTPHDFLRLPALLAKDVGFFDVDWPKLSRYAKRHFRHPSEFLRMARDRRRSLNGLLSFLRGVIPNANRFLVPMKINDEISKALEQWREQWSNDNSRRHHRN